MENTSQPAVAVKFCGITNEQDALAALSAGATALGFNGWSRSKRYLDLAASASWIRELPPFAVRVTVLVNPRRDEALRVMDLGCFELLQLHGDETPGFCADLAEHGVRLIKALPLAQEADLARIAEFPAANILLDAHAPGVYGGTGRVIDWKLARQAVELYPHKRIILSGGLHSGNVLEAITEVKPYAVDTASGIESKPGRKDAGKMQAFIRQLKEC